MTAPGPHWDAAWRRIVAACGEARRRFATGGAPPGEPAEYPAMAPPPTPAPDRPVLRDDLARLAALTRAYLVSHSSAGPEVTVGLLVTSRGPGDLAFGVNVLPGADPLPPGAIGPPIAVEASRSLLTSPIARAGRLLPGDGGGLRFEPAPGFLAPVTLSEEGEPADLAALLLAAFETARAG